MIKKNIENIKQAIPNNVTLVAVSKTKPNHMILEAYDAGQKDFGENYVQELINKYAQLPQDICWHFIGHLQSNKVKYIAPFVYLIHGIDSLTLLKTINKEGKKNNRVINCLLQLFIAREETKFGFSIAEASDVLNSELLPELKFVNVLGFMAMASNTATEAQVRQEFKSVKKLQEKYPQYNTLSYGMSNDYLIAVEEGSTMVRIGSNIFGTR